ncbi:hypothetical protein SKAU_G00339800 [Synaphobranchus kaupii]|uniref:D-aminoacyl-tRNA deacylase n=1 Tax=Synaphobranchus kaupii TaxID=118154 RepID=A0A9Q1EMR7_SYNKA|nr:hypothetical protein SKAU_G00339800 [Synaphobranchus kaupii]
MPVCSAFKCNARTGCNKDDSKVTFHRFPLKQPEKLKIWIRITQKDHWTPTPNSVLCSRHFKEDCFDRTGQTTRIRAGAVPTIVLFPRKKSQLLGIRQCEQTEMKNCAGQKRGRRGKEERGAVALRSPTPATTADHRPNLHSYCGYGRRVEPRPLQATDHPYAVTEAPGLPADHLYAVSESPVRLKRRCNDMTDKLEACRRKLKMEQQKVRRWHRDVARLKASVKALRAENAAPPGFAEMVERTFSGVPKELVKRMMGEKRPSLEYAEELKAFAFKLRLLSPKAYTYVRSSFQQALPHPQAMRMWRARGKVVGDGDGDGDDASPEESAEELREFRMDADGKRGAAPLHARTAIQQCQYARLRVKPEEEDSFAEWVEIHKGMVVYICFFKGATEKLIPKMVKALLNVKLFEAGPGKQASVLELPGSVLVVPQDTLGGQAKRRSMHYPHNIDGSRGVQLYASFVTQLESQLASCSKCAEAGVVVRYGVFGERQALLMDSDGLSTHLMEF